MRFLRKNTATRVSVGPFLDLVDGVTPEVALDVTAMKLTAVVDANDGSAVTLVLDTAPTASGGNNDMVHITGDDAGFYDLELTAANTNYNGRFILSLFTVASHRNVDHEFTILPAMIYDAFIAGTDVLETDVTQLLGTAWLTPAVAGTADVNTKTITANAITATAIAADAITAAKIADGAIDAATFASGAITATAIAADALGASELAADAVTEIGTGTAGSSGGF